MIAAGEDTPPLTSLPHHRNAVSRRYVSGFSGFQRYQRPAVPDPRLRPAVQAV